MRLTLVVPELLWPEPSDQTTYTGAQAPGLQWLLARRPVQRQKNQPWEFALAALFGRSGDAPLGALRLLGEAPALAARAREGCWLNADPVHLRFHQERIVLADAGAFELVEAEAAAFIATLNREFADVGEFHLAEPRRWYVRLHQASDHAALPLSAVAGRRMDGDLPEGGHARLRQWLNEIQMVLHGHPVNEQRQAAGHPAVNSLWLWGAGELPPAPTTEAAPFTGVWAGQPLARGLARAAGIHDHPPAAGLSALLAQASPKDHPLVILDDLLAPTSYEDSAAWLEALARLEAQWFAPLRTALGGKVSELTLIAPTIFGQLTWHLTGADRWRFWRRPQPLAALANQLALAPLDD